MSVASWVFHERYKRYKRRRLEMGKLSEAEEFDRLQELRCAWEGMTKQERAQAIDELNIPVGSENEPDWVRNS